MEFATGAVDNIYFTAELDTERCAWEPLAYPSTVEAHEQLLPSLAVPSDHAPSLVDFRLARNTLTKASPLQLPVDWGKLVKTPLKVKWNKPWGKKLRDAKPSSLTEQVCAQLDFNGNKSCNARPCFHIETFGKCIHFVIFVFVSATRDAAHKAQGTRYGTATRAGALL